MSFVTKFARQFIAKRKEPYTFSPPEDFKLKPNNKEIGLYIHVPFWQLYNTKISKQEFKELFGCNLKDEFPKFIKTGKLFNCFEESSNEINLTKRGINLFHVIELIYTRNYLERVWGKCLKEPWPDEMKLF